MSNVQDVVAKLREKRYVVLGLLVYNPDEDRLRLVYLEGQDPLLGAAVLEKFGITGPVVDHKEL